ncbi:MAG TPA: DUF4097 family beta strand repeat-containing protein [Gammaproteobacteria bacterium]
MRIPALLCAAVLAAAAAGPVAAAQSFEKTDTYKNPAIKAGGSLSLSNLVGHVSVVTAADGVLSVDSKVVAASGSDAEAQALAAKLKIVPQVDGNSVTLHAEYPLDDYTEYYYHGNGSNFGMSTSTVSYDGERVRISNGTFGSGANLHADFVVHVPKGVHVTVDNKVGLIEASGVNAPLTLKSASGDIKAEKGSDSLSGDTGSGDITVTDHNGAVKMDTGSGDIILTHQKGGDVDADTGSGDVNLTDVAGTLTADTGSGDVNLQKYSGNGAKLDTGSGSIVIHDATGSMKLEAGSGDITATGFKAGQVLEISTGSGSVSIEGDLGDVLRLSADAGSGDITIRTSRVPSLHITATSDSGDVDVDLPGMQNVSAKHHSIRADVNGAKGTAELDASSGDVSFTKS